MNIENLKKHMILALFIFIFFLAIYLLMPNLNWDGSQILT
jgi:hypothetical protein